MRILSWFGTPLLVSMGAVLALTGAGLAGQRCIGQVGIASYYGPGFHGRRTASGERFNQHAMTAAHRTLPFGTRVRVTSLGNGKAVVVRINDRGPFSRGRVIDLSRGAAVQLGIIRAGVANVCVTRIQR
jgi:rare lipoprotein A